MIGRHDVERNATDAMVHGVHLTGRDYANFLKATALAPPPVLAELEAQKGREFWINVFHDQYTHHQIAHNSRNVADACAKNDSEHRVDCIHVREVTSGLPEAQKTSEEKVIETYHIKDGRMWVEVPQASEEKEAASDSVKAVLQKARKRHSLKVWPEYFEALADGKKTFEARRLDRDYQVGDELALHEFCRVNGFTDRLPLIRQITYLLTGPKFGIERGYCVMSLTAIPSENFNVMSAPPVTPNPSSPSTAAGEREELLSRIKSYLVSGGLFNPEMALHDRVRDLLIDIRDFLSVPPVNVEPQDSGGKDAN